MQKNTKLIANNKKAYHDYFIDDTIRNCEQALEKTNTKVIMMETNKTKDYKNNEIFKASNWQAIYDYIININSFDDNLV